MSRSVTRLTTSAMERPCFCSSATYSLLYSVPICGGLDLPSVVTVVRYTLPLLTIGEDHPRPGISCDHSTFSVLDQRSANLGSVPTGFESGPRNCGHSMSFASIRSDAKKTMQTTPARSKKI